MMAMLCILRGDLLLELYGMTNEHIERLDDNDSGYRRTYFWRNSLRTLEEIKKVLRWISKRSRSGSRPRPLRRRDEARTPTQN